MCLQLSRLADALLAGDEKLCPPPRLTVDAITLIDIPYCVW